MVAWLILLHQSHKFVFSLWIPIGCFKPLCCQVHQKLSFIKLDQLWFLLKSLNYWFQFRKIWLNMEVVRWDSKIIWTHYKFFVKDIGQKVKIRISFFQDLIKFARRLVEIIHGFPKVHLQERLIVIDENWLKVLLLLLGLADKSWSMAWSIYRFEKIGSTDKGAFRPESLSNYRLRFVWCHLHPRLEFWMEGLHPHSRSLDVHSSGTRYISTCI